MVSYYVVIQCNAVYIISHEYFPFPCARQGEHDSLLIYKSIAVKAVQIISVHILCWRLNEVLPYGTKFPISMVVWKRRIVWQRKKQTMVCCTRTVICQKQIARDFIQVLLSKLDSIESTGKSKFNQIHIPIPSVCGETIVRKNGWFSRKKTNSFNLQAIITWITKIRFI